MGKQRLAQRRVKKKVTRKDDVEGDKVHGYTQGQWPASTAWMAGTLERGVVVGAGAGAGVGEDRAH